MAMDMEMARIYQNMFGDADWQKSAAILVERHHGDKIAAASSILSDAQEELAMGDKERSRQFINRAKHILNQAQDDQSALRNLMNAEFGKMGVIR